jgi:hypothetical protein
VRSGYENYEPTHSHKFRILFVFVSCPRGADTRPVRRVLHLPKFYRKVGYLEQSAPAGEHDYEAAKLARENG